MIVKHHPHRYFLDGDAEKVEVQDTKQLRFDFIHLEPDPSVPPAAQR